MGPEDTAHIQAGALSLGHRGCTSTSGTSSLKNVPTSYNAGIIVPQASLRMILKECSEAHRQVNSDRRSP